MPNPVYTYILNIYRLPQYIWDPCEANNSTDNNVFVFVSDLKIVYNNNY